MLTAGIYNFFVVVTWESCHEGLYPRNCNTNMCFLWQYFLYVGFKILIKKILNYNLVSSGHIVIIFITISVNNFIFLCATSFAVLWIVYCFIFLLIILFRYACYTTRIPEMLGHFFFLHLNKKLKDFQITLANVLFTIEHREHKCLSR